jgi:hypothetical protein
MIKHVTPVGASETFRTALLEATRSELRALLEAEDFGPKQIQAAKRLCETVQPLVADVTSQLAQRGLNPVSPFLNGMGTYQTGGLAEPVYDSDGGGMYINPVGPLASANSTETYAAALLREFVPTLRELIGCKHKVDLPELVQAIAEAHASGLTEVEADLREQLRVRCGSTTPVGVMVADLPPPDADPQLPLPFGDN